MRWRGGRESGNVEDRRGKGGLVVGGGIGTLLLGLLLYFFGGENAVVLLQSLQERPLEQRQSATNDVNDINNVNVVDNDLKFVRVVLGYTEDVWTKLFKEQLNRDYVPPQLVLFSLSTQSECGQASSQTGPFYCPLDSKVYIDLSFYRDLQEKFQAPGDFAMAYVIAHEVGHHIQNLLGITDHVHNQRERVSQKDYNRLSVKLELQADFLAGVWAHHTQQMKDILEEGDIEEALNAANAIGDDRLQHRSGGEVVPDAFTHGTSEQRVRWFRKGYLSGEMSQGNTFDPSGNRPWP